MSETLISSFGTPFPSPVVFGDCVGWFHPAATPGGRAVLMLGTDGYEALCAYRPWRDIARSFAAAGLAVLRFDYAGQGDSGGPEESPPDLDAWVEQAVEAAAVLRRLSGCSEVAVVGLRLGAMVAARAVARLETAPMVLLFPVVSGRLHAREMRVQAHRGPDGPEVFGFPWSEEALGSVAGFDLGRTLAAAAPRPILLLAQDRVAEAARKAAALLPYARVGVTEGFEEMFAEAHAVETPNAAIAEMVTLLASDMPTAPAGAPETPGPVILTLPGGSTEVALRFGPDASLVGALTLPPGGARPGTVALLIPNTGVNHHIGNGRLSVLMARRAAAAGMAAFRYDARAHGESENPGGLPLVRIVQQPAVVEDARVAIDLLESLGHPRVVMVGNCAGGWTALHTAIADTRVSHAAAVNIQRFIWKEGRTFTVPSRRQSAEAMREFQWQALREAWQARASPLDMLRAVTPNHLKMVWKRSVVRSLATVGRILPPALSRMLGPAQVAEWLRTLSERGTDVTFLYSDQDTGLEELESHFGDGGRHLEGMRGIDLVLVPGADHIFSTRSMRRTVLAKLDPVLRMPPSV